MSMNIQFQAQLAVLLMAHSHARIYPQTKPKPEALTERERWNAEVDRRKQEKKARTKLKGE